MGGICSRETQNGPAHANGTLGKVFRGRSYGSKSGCDRPTTLGLLSKVSRELLLDQTPTEARSLSADGPLTARLLPAALALTHEAWESPGVSMGCCCLSPPLWQPLASRHHTASPTCSYSLSHEKDGFEIQGTLNKGTRFQSSSSSRWKRYTY